MALCDSITYDRVHAKTHPSNTPDTQGEAKSNRDNYSKLPVQKPGKGKEHTLVYQSSACAVERQTATVRPMMSITSLAIESSWTATLAVLGSDEQHNFPCPLSPGLSVKGTLGKSPLFVASALHTHFLLEWDGGLGFALKLSKH